MRKEQRPRRKMGTGCQFPSFLYRKCFLYLVSSRGERCGGRGKAKENSEKGIHWPQSFYSWFQSGVCLPILSILWAKQHPSEKTVILPHRAQTPAHSNHSILRKTTQFVFIQMMGKICLIGNRCTSFSPVKFGGVRRHGQGNHMHEKRNVFWKCSWNHQRKARALNA